MLYHANPHLVAPSDCARDISLTVALSGNAYVTDTLRGDYLIYRWLGHCTYGGASAVHVVMHYYRY